MIEINRSLSLPEDEIRFTFSRSGGPGGQNVNKLSTRATLWFDVAGSPTLTESQKDKILQRLGNRISKDGVLQVVSMQFRTQKGNREDALRRFASLLAVALIEKPRRKKTRIPRGAKESRLQAKKRRSRVKTTRAGKTWDD
ncbi:MAG TPA: aminoacyl-tRNA hydrolase [Desulfobacteraceae bacterium]|nr:aminoacyl-tRNA hydrolase [Desulfobacteraceae bacterium]HER63627.1 aminoacyl-tRNA hydrolase [Desulfobacteraceae bacterium]